MLVLKIDTAQPAPAVVERAAQALMAGDLVVAPTETRYGLLARADRPEVLARLYRVKNRALSRPTALLIRKPSEALELARFGPYAAALAGRYLPGPVTLVLEATVDWPPPIVVDGKIGLRCSLSAVIDALLKNVEAPITATSANISGRGERDCVQDIADDFGDEIALYLDGGPLTGPPSTVVDCTGAQPRVLREGAVSGDEIAQLMSDVNE